MKQLLILSTIFLLFIFTNQLLAQPLNNTKKPFIKIIKDGRPLTRFIPVNHTSCLYGEKLSCFKSKFNNKTYCFCIKSNSSSIRNYHDLIHKCRLGTVRKCRYNFKTKMQNCYCETIPQILKPDIIYSCPTGTILKCKKMLGDKKDCKCEKKKPIPTPVRIKY